MPFVKGASGNPRGRPKQYADLVAAAKEKTKFALDKIYAWAEQDGDPQVSLRACQYLLETGWGKPSQRIEVTGKEGGPVIYKWQDSPAQVPPT